jgi:hypothetical protein
MLLVGIALMAAGAALTLAGPLWLVVIGVAVFTAGYFVTSPVASAMTAFIAGPCRSQATAIHQLVFYGGNSLFVWSLGRVFEALDWPGVVVGLVVLCAIAATVALAVLPSRVGGRPDTATD